MFKEEVAYFAEALGQGKLVHAHIIQIGFSLTVYLETKLVILFTKYGCLEYAHQLFDKMPERNLITWTASFPKSYMRHGQNVMSGKIESLYLTSAYKIPPSIKVNTQLQACALLALHSNQTLFFSDFFIRMAILVVVDIC